MTEESEHLEMAPATAEAVHTAPAPEAWTSISSAGDLTLAQSTTEYAVYDGQRTYGRWPLTDDGRKSAFETFEAHRQSLAHGIAYTATGYQDPARLGLPTDPIMKSKTYASPMSYVGSTRRIVAWATKTSKRSPAFGVLAWTMAVMALISVWVFLVGWYFVTFVLFGVFMIPYRLVRRSQRKNLHVQQTALATQQAMLQQMSLQQQAMAQQMQRSGQSPSVGPPS